MFSIIRAASKLRPLQYNKIVIDKAIQLRWAHNAPLTYDFARERIMLILRLYDKIDPNRLTLDSHFVNDLGLDSLDRVDIIMELEDEFLFEIPDKDAEKLMTPGDILKYITDKEEAYKELQDLHAAHHHDHGHGHESHNGHDNHHEPNLVSSHGDHNISGNQKREFCSWSRTAILYAKEEDVYPTTFRSVPKKEVNFDDVQERVMKVCSKYDKIDSSQLKLSSHFVDDLGLDSLDHVEIMMELEDEFGLEISDQDAEKLMRPAEIARYIFKKEEARSLTYEDRNF